MMNAKKPCRDAALALAVVLAAAAPGAHAERAHGAPAGARAPARTAMIPAPSAPVSEFRVVIDQARPLSAPGPVRGIVVGNPAIAGVSMQNERLVFVTGRSYGSTNLILVGDRGPIFQGRIVVVSDETNAVFLTRGAWSVRYDCTPECKRRPDISDEPNAFGQAMSAINARSGSAKE